MSDSFLDRMAVKTCGQRFVHTLETEFEFAPRVAQEVLAVAQEMLVAAGGEGSTVSLKPGQVRHIVASIKAPHGRPLADSQMVEVVWTVDSGPEDAEVRHKFGRTALRQTRILRLAEEAADQGGLATEEDLAQALHVDPRTIRRDVRRLAGQGYRVPTRGKVKGIGRGQSHKVVIVELYLQRHPYEDIQRRTHHSLAAIKRYIAWFGRVVLAQRRGLTPLETAFMLGISQNLVQQYLDLLARSQGPEEQAVISDLVARLSGEGRVTGAEKGGLRR